MTVTTWSVASFAYYILQYLHDVLRLVASAPERKQAWNSLGIYGGDWQRMSCETQWSAPDHLVEFLTLMSTKFTLPIS